VGRRVSPASGAGQRRRGLAGTPAVSPAPGSAPAGLAPAGARKLASIQRPAKHDSGNPLDAIGRAIPLPIPVPDWSKPIILALVLLALWFGARSRLAARRAKRLERQRATLQRDLEVMQTAVVPDVPLHVGGLRVSAAYRAAEGPAAGGDFYDVFTPEPGKVAVILGDVVGHGHEALNDAALTRYTLRAYVQAGLEPRAALALAGQVLTEAGHERYVTVVVGLFEPAAGELTYATAGHPTPMIVGSFEPPAISTCPALSCGLPTGRRQTTVSLAAGAEVCFFSDGLVEARVREGLFGRERLREMLPSLGREPDAAELLGSIREEADSCPDDMAACIVIPEAEATRGAVYREELEADAEALAEGHAQSFLEAFELSAGEIHDALEIAGEIADARGSAVLRVEIEAAGTTVAVSIPAFASAASRMAARIASPPATGGPGPGLPLTNVG
jgi:hypothetical protein